MDIQQLLNALNAQLLAGGSDYLEVLLAGHAQSPFVVNGVLILPTYSDGYTTIAPSYAVAGLDANDNPAWHVFNPYGRHLVTSDVNEAVMHMMDV